MLFYLREVMNTSSDSDARKFDNKKWIFLNLKLDFYN